MALTQVKSDGIATGAVTADQIAANAVTVDDIADGSISTAKLADANVTTAKIADDAVTADKLANTAVTAGSYTLASVTVDAQGRITAASSGTAGDADKIEEGNTSAEVVDTGSDGHFKVVTEGTEALRVDSSQRVGIGTTSVSAKLHSSSGSSSVTPNVSADELFLESSGNVGLQFGCPNTGNARISFGDPEDNEAGRIFYDHSTNAMQFDIAGSERARIDSAGRLLVGTSTGANRNLLQIQGDVDNGATGVGGISLRRGLALGSIGNGSTLGQLDFCMSDGGVAARIVGEAEGSAGTDDYPGRLEFYTTADGASSPTERMRILSDGSFTNCVGIYNDTTGDAANMVVNSSGTLKRSTSSIKYKTDVENAEDQYSDALLRCRPVWYRSTCKGDNPAYSYWGFIAEEVAEIDPRLVHWKTTEPVVQENGTIENIPCKPEPEGVAYERFVPHLLKLIKRQKEQLESQAASIASLEARLTALES